MLGMSLYASYYSFGNASRFVFSFSAHQKRSTDSTKDWNNIVLHKEGEAQAGAVQAP